MKTRVRKGRVDKEILLLPGHRAVYQRHRVSSMSGTMSFGHHAMLRFPEQEGSGLVSTSAFSFGMTAPLRFEDPASGGYSSLAVGAPFEDLASVPALDGTRADLTAYPARRGFEDLVQVMHDPGVFPAWNAVSFPRERFLWLALKDPAMLTGTLLWHSNGGRHYAPWNGRHVNVLGIEDVTSYFHYGLKQSAAANDLSRRGYVTALRLKASRPLVVSYVMLCVPTPAGFGRISRVEAEADGRSVIAFGARRRRLRIAVDVDFLRA